MDRRIVITLREAVGSDLPHDAGGADAYRGGGQVRLELIECGTILSEKPRPEISLRLLVQPDELIASPLENLARKTRV